jgi:hypothetical protein
MGDTEDAPAEKPAVMDGLLGIGAGILSIALIKKGLDIITKEEDSKE